jgi:hypothetical protein
MESLLHEAMGHHTRTHPQRLHVHGAAVPRAAALLRRLELHSAPHEKGREEVRRRRRGGLPPFLLRRRSRTSSLPPLGHRDLIARVAAEMRGHPTRDLLHAWVSSALSAMAAASLRLGLLQQDGIDLPHRAHVGRSGGDLYARKIRKTKTSSTATPSAVPTPRAPLLRARSRTEGSHLHRRWPPQAASALSSLDDAAHEARGRQGKSVGREEQG